MLKFISAAFALVLALGSGAARADDLYHEFTFTGTDIFSLEGDASPLASVSGRFIFSSGESWMDPSHLLHSDFTIGGKAFSAPDLFYGPDAVSFTQGSQEVGRDAFSMYFFNDGSASLVFTQAGSDALWLVNTLMTHHTVSTSPIPFKVGVVPEPETYAMLLSGLALLGYAARRRRQHD